MDRGIDPWDHISFLAKEVLLTTTRKTRVIPYGGLRGSELRVRTRDFATGAYSEQVTKVTAAQSSLKYLHGIQVTDSESHPAWTSHKNGRYRGDIGGPFTSAKRYAYNSIESAGSVYGQVVYDPTPAMPTGSKGQTVIFDGPILPCAPISGYMPWPASSASSESALVQAGTAAIARCSPSNPSASLAVTIGELFKEGIPAVVGGVLKQWSNLSNRDRRRAIGNEYLNVEFGWKPLIRDITAVASAIVSADKIMSDYERNSGRMVRRRYVFPEFVETKISTLLDGMTPYTEIAAGGMYYPGSTNQGKVMKQEQLVRRQWFSGAFSYYVPPPTGLRNSIARDVILAKKWLGLSLTPDTLWNLAPWSWAVDWFGSTGDLITNWSNWAIDNQVLMYGYLMEHSYREVSYIFVGRNPLKGGATPATVTLVNETKLRRQSSPYGFGIGWKDLSNRQKAIVAALGISKSR